MMGWPGANSTTYQYLTHAKILPSHHKAKRRGAFYEFTQLWNFLSEELYLKGAFIDLVRKIILGVNIYYFFIRRNCLPKCLDQLFNTFSSENKAEAQSQKLKDFKKCIELLTIMYLSGLGLLPGGHRQFMLGIIEILPFTLVMAGLDPLIYLNVYRVIWCADVNLEAAFVRHIGHLALCFYLLTAGPLPLRGI